MTLITVTTSAGWLLTWTERTKSWCSHSWLKGIIKWFSWISFNCPWRYWFWILLCSVLSVFKKNYWGRRTSNRILIKDHNINTCLVKAFLLLLFTNKDCRKIQLIVLIAPKHFQHFRPERVWRILLVIFRAFIPLCITCLMTQMHFLTFFVH